MIRKSAPLFDQIIQQSANDVSDQSLHDSKLRLHALNESSQQVKKLALILEKTSLRVKKNKSRSRSPNIKATLAENATEQSDSPQPMPN